MNRKLLPGHGYDNEWERRVFRVQDYIEHMGTAMAKRLIGSGRPPFTVPLTPDERMARIMTAGPAELQQLLDQGNSPKKIGDEIEKAVNRWYDQHGSIETAGYPDQE